MMMKPEVVIYLSLCAGLALSAVYLIGSKHYKDGVLGVLGLLGVAIVTSAQVADYGVRGSYFDRETIDVVMAASVFVFLLSRCIRTAYRGRMEKKQVRFMTAKQVARQNIIEAL